MKTSDFDYVLPEELIAQTPMEPRDHSRLMVVHRGTGAIEHKHFYDLPQYLRPGDALVINETKVIPARLLGVKEDTGVPVEVLLLRRGKRHGLGSPGAPGPSPEARGNLRFRGRSAALHGTGKRGGDRRAAGTLPVRGRV